MKMKTIRVTTIAVLALSMLTFSSCKRKGCTDELATNYESKAKKDDGTCEYGDAAAAVTFGHVVGANVLVFSDMMYYSAAGHKYSIETAKYVVSRVTVLSADGDVEIFENMYVDAEDASTLSQMSTTVLPPGDYTGITFTFGLAAADNVSSAFSTVPETNMFWPEPMGGGYHFMKLEGQYDSLNTGAPNHAYNTHVGSIDMTAMTMVQENSWEVSFNENFTIQGATEVEFYIEMDIQKWFETPNTYDFTAWNNGTMGEMMAQTQLKENGAADVFTLAVHLPD
jgi:hypothetical protein